MKGVALVDLAKNDGPYGAWPKPTEKDCEEVLHRLAALHGEPRRGCSSRRKVAGARRVGGVEDKGCGDAPSILDALIGTILSQNTTGRNSRRAMAEFRRCFEGDYQKVLRAPLASVVKSIHCGGLANIKGLRIKELVHAIHQEHGVVSLEHLRDLPDAAIKMALMRYPGVGPKTASCVLLFCLGRDSFAVDTHVFRITKKIGWVPPKATREQAHLHLDVRIPKRYHYPLHVLFVRHGKSCYACAANNRPQQRSRGPCPL